MAHEYTITTGTDVSLSALNDELAATTFDRVLSDGDKPASERTLPDDTTEYRARIYAADTEARADVLAELEAVFSAATTAIIEYRHTWAEYDDQRVADPAYYPSDLTTGLRSDPSLSDNDEYTTTVSAAYRVADNNYEITDTTHQHSPPSDYVRIDRLVGTADGLTVLEGEPQGVPNEVGTEPSAPNVPADGVDLGTVVVKSHVDRIVRGGLTPSTQVGDASEQTTVFEK